jgi:hypothetical protein
MLSGTEVHDWLAGAALVFLAAIIVVFSTLLGSLLMWIGGAEPESPGIRTVHQAADKPIRKAA